MTCLPLARLVAIVFVALSFTGSLSAASTTIIPVGKFPKYAAVNVASNRIYVSNISDSTVSVIDGALNKVIGTVSVGSLPEGLDVNSSTNMIYVANSAGNSVSVIDGKNNTLVTTVTGMSFPFGVSVNANSNQIYVSNAISNNVVVIDGATNTILTKILVGSSPAGIALNAHTNFLYIANNGSGTISEIDCATNTVVNTFTLPSPSQPAFVAVDSKTNRLFVADALTPQVYVLDASTGSLLATVTGGKVPFQSVFFVFVWKPGNTVLVTDYAAGKVYQLNESTYAVSAGFKGLSFPNGIAVNPKTRKLYIVNSGNNAVTVYSQSGALSSRRRTPMTKPAPPVVPLR